MFDEKKTYHFAPHIRKVVSKKRQTRKADGDGKVVIIEMGKTLQKAMHSHSVRYDERKFLLIVQKVRACLRLSNYGWLHAGE